MKILLVSWSILPNKGGTSVIVENLAKNFSADELIILGSRQPFQNLEVDRPKSGPAFRYFLSELYLFGRGYRYFVWFRKWRFQPLVNEIKNIIKKEKIDHVIGVYPNPFYCQAACRAAKALNIPFSAYFHNTYIENVEITDPEAPARQKEIFDYASNIFVMSKGMQRYYEANYTEDKFIPLVHTFNQFPSAASMTGVPGTAKKTYKLVAIGNFNESNMDATIRLANAIKDNPKYSLHLYTHVPNLLLRKRGLDPALIHHEGFVTPEEVHDVLQDYDICVLTHGFVGGYGEVEYQTIFPTRTIPFLLSDKPILAHSPDGSFLNDFLTENDCAELVNQADPQAIVAGLDRIADDLDYQKQLVDAAQKTAHQFHGPVVVEQLKAQLKKHKTLT